MVQRPGDNDHRSPEARGFDHPSRWIGLALILVGYIVASVTFSVVVPVLEAPDETSHVATVRYISQHRALPVQRPPVFPTGQEGSQPPLYYILGAPLWGLAPDQAVAPTWAVNNPRVNFDRAPEPRDNRMLYAHSRAEGFPYQGDVLAIHLVRLLSVALGVLTITGTFGLAREIFPDRPLVALLAAAVVAFNPLFAFMSGVVNNDNAIAATSALVLWCLARWLRRGGSTGLAITLGVGLGFALLSKTSGLLLAAATLSVLLTDRWVAASGLPVAGSRSAPSRRLRSAVVARALGPLREPSWWRRLAIVAALAAVVSGWWFIRNQVLYGDPLGWRVMLLSNGSMVREQAMDPLAAAGLLWAARWTFWGIFGWTNVVFSPPVYRALDGGTAVAAVAAGIALVRWLAQIGRGTRLEIRRVLGVALLVGWPIAVFISLIRWVQIVEAADQWRLMFPAMAALGVLLAFGLDQAWRLLAGLIGRFGMGRPRAIGPGLFLGASVLIAPIGTAINLGVALREVAPVYRPIVSAPAPPATDRSLNFGSEITLLDYQVQPRSLTPGESATVDLIWLARHPVPQNLTVAVTVLAEDGALLAQTVDWPQGGRAPTIAWSPGEALPDHYQVTPRWTGPEPQLATVWVSLYDGGDPGAATLAVTDRQGQPVGNGARVGTLKLAATESLPLPSTAIDATFGSSLQLLGYDRAQVAHTLRLTLYWSLLQPFPEDATVFVHVTTADGRVVAQHDSPPRNGRYPTSAWEVGEIIGDPHEIALQGLPAGHYRVIAGLYRPASGERLPVEAGRALSVVDRGVVLFDLTIPP